MTDIRERFLIARMRRSLQRTREEVAHVYDRMPPQEKVQNARWLAEKKVTETLEKLGQAPESATPDQLNTIRHELEKTVYGLVEEVFGVKLH